jgi:hypothetical protein
MVPRKGRSLEPAAGTCIGLVIAAVSGITNDCTDTEKRGAAASMKTTDAGPDVTSDSRAAEDASSPQCPASKQNSRDGGLCRLPRPGTSDASAPPYACWDQPGAPGAEACAPGAADAYGIPCCVAGSCGHDYGSGCTTRPAPLPGQTANAPSACGSSANGVGRVYSGGAAAAMNSGFAFAVEGSGAGTFRIVAINKASCASTALSQFAERPMHLSATEEAVYWHSPDGHAVFKALPNGGAAPVVVDLLALFPSVEVEARLLGSGGENVYAIVNHRPRGCPLDFRATAIVEIPCCGASPKIVRDDGGTLSGDRLVRDGAKLFMFGSKLVLDRGNYATLRSFDLTSGSATLVIDSDRADATFGGVHSGLAYLALWRQIWTFDPGTCESNVIAESCLFSSVPAMTTDDRGVYWAEAYSDLSVSRIFARAHGTSSVVQVVETSRPVEWLAIDETHLYWAEVPTSGEPPVEYWLSRIRRPL